MNGTGILQVPEAVRSSFKPVLDVLDTARRKLAGTKYVVTVRPGYKYSSDAAPLPAIVVAVTPGTTPIDANALEKQIGVPVVVSNATVEEQLAARGPEGAAAYFGAAEASTASAFERMLSGEELVAFAAPKTGSYEEPDPPMLKLVKEQMDVTICVSPEAGWGELESFLEATESNLTVAMYQFTAPHIFNAVKAAVAPAGRKLELVLHPVPEKPAKSGVKAHDLDEEEEVIDPLTNAMKTRFQMAWATLHSNARPEGLWASAYHIKVAVRDSSAIWLSSGNWQSSNQPDVHPFVPH